MHRSVGIFGFWSTSTGSSADNDAGDVVASLYLGDAPLSLYLLSHFPFNPDYGGLSFLKTLSAREI